jgi:hypothetical protein
MEAGDLVRELLQLTRIDDDGICPFNAHVSSSRRITVPGSRAVPGILSRGGRLGLMKTHGGAGLQGKSAR